MNVCTKIRVSLHVRFMHVYVCIVLWCIFPMLGPFWCAQDDVDIALSACMKKPSLIDVSELVTITHTTALTTTIDFPRNLKGDRVYLFSGTKDSVVVSGKYIATSTNSYYSRYTDTDNYTVVEV